MLRAWVFSLQNEQHRHHKAKRTLLLPICLLALFSIVVIVKYEIIFKDVLKFQNDPTTQRIRIVTPDYYDDDDDELVEGAGVDSEHHQKSHAVVHMGIHKTGTTTIQRISSQVYLTLDGYEIPWNINEEKNSRVGEGEAMELYETSYGMQKSLQFNHANFASCFCSPSERRIYPCDPDLLLSGLDIAQRKRNIFLTAEKFTSIDSQGLDFLSSYLSRWDEVTIIIYYRRFHSWIGSFYNQDTKYRKLADTDLWERSIVDYVVDHINNPKLLDKYALALLQRVEGRFDKVKVMNYHNKSASVEESFFCDAMPHASHTCDAVRSRKFSMQVNPSPTLDYHDLAYGAMKAGMIEINTDGKMRNVAIKIKRHQEQTLKLRSSDFERVCLPTDILEKVWQLSLSTESMLFPEQVNSTKDDLKFDFDKATRTTLCKLDVEKILGKDEWQSFFEQLRNE